ncbi:serine hydrolase-domain-containing protein [Bisporella sp. PMI_857]|nr:serine hydrolase-domain-containing protein [Bisporella sp. PMI_857]
MKVLVLHGYTQSGPGFQKTIKKLESRLEREFRDDSISFYFPTGPIPLRPSQMIAASASHQEAENAPSAQQNPYEKADPDNIDCYAWFRLHDHDDPPFGFTLSLEMLAEVLNIHGPFDGIIGFSQGGLMAIMVASLLEGELRQEAFAQAQKKSADIFPFPDCYKNIQHPPFKFGITYGALMGVGEKYAPFYDCPRIQTPFCQFSGLWDPVVSMEMKLAVERAQIGGGRSLQVTHPGAHSVCTQTKYLDILVDFIKGVQNHAMLPTSIEGSISSTVGELCLTSTTLSSDESQSSRNASRPRRKGLRRMSRNKVKMARFAPQVDEPHHRSPDPGSNLTSIYASSTDEEENLIEKQQRLSIALQNVLTAWTQEKEFHRSLSSQDHIQEMAERILRTIMQDGLPNIRGVT